MPLVTTRDMLRDAQANRYAVGAFNIENMEMAQAVIAAAEELSSPVIVQTTPGTVGYAGLAMYRAMVAALAERAKVPVAIHLDHGNSFGLAAQAIRQGYTSVMIDGSQLPLEENIALSASVVEMAAPSEIPVEAELGMVGGKEDDLEAESGGYTDPAQAERFVRETGIGSLAVAIGTAHGPYARTPVLDVDRLSQIHRVVDIPLVLHGASGLSDQDIRGCVEKGICKVNFATELRIAYSDGVKAVLAANPDAYDPKKFGEEGRRLVRELVMDRIRVCGSQNRI